MFYASYKLLQELIIIKKIGYRVSEIHLIDTAYSDIHDFRSAFQFFSDQVHKINPLIKIFFYDNLSSIEDDELLKNRIDIIGGIDIDYVHSNMNHFDHRFQIKYMASGVLKVGGRLVVSQHFNDLIDISEYQCDPCGKILPVIINDYVKSDFYDEYQSNHIPHMNYSHKIHPISCVLI